MENENFLEKVAAQLGQSASVKNVYGTPVTVGDKTIIPVSRIALGFGGGYGQGHKPKNKATDPTVATRGNNSEGEGEGAGGGGGMYVQPKGVFEITPLSTRFIPVNRYRELIIGLCIGMLMVMRHSYGKKRRRP